MIISWILNTLSKDIVESFVYANNAKELWDSIANRYGQSNGPLLYKLQREITSITQGNDTVVEYFSQIKRLWDQFDNLKSPTICSCPFGKNVIEIENQTKLLQFLMGLHDVYEPVRSQVLLMEPLPEVDKTYSMLVRVEQQKNTSMMYNNQFESSAMVRNTFGRGNMGRGGNYAGNKAQGRGRGRWRTKEEKAKLVCEYCHGHGHDMGECFKLHGVPDWYHKFKEQQKPKGFANAAVEKIDAQSSTSKSSSQTSGAACDLSSLIQQELLKFFNSKGSNEVTEPDYVHFVSSAGP